MFVVISNLRNLCQMVSSAVVDLLTLMTTSKVQSIPEIIENWGGSHEGVGFMEPTLGTLQRKSSHRCKTFLTDPQFILSILLRNSKTKQTHTYTKAFWAPGKNTVFL